MVLSRGMNTAWWWDLVLSWGRKTAWRWDLFFLREKHTMARFSLGRREEHKLTFRFGLVLRVKYNLTVRCGLVSREEHRLMVRFGLVLRVEHRLSVKSGLDLKEKQPDWLHLSWRKNTYWQWDLVLYWGRNKGWQIWSRAEGRTQNDSDFWGSQCSYCEVYYLLGCDFVRSLRSLPMFRNSLMHSCLRQKNPATSACSGTPVSI